MADEQYRWLDSDAAERLLRGEPLDAVDDVARAHAARIAETLSELAAPPLPTSDELPGEVSAVAAFRAARTARHGERTGVGGPASGRSAAPSGDAGLVRLGRPVADGRQARRWRPVRFALAGVVAAGMIGGAAVAAGTGALPTPFHEPRPAASVSAAATPPMPLLTPTPEGTQTRGSTSPTPTETNGAPAQGTSSQDEVGAGAAATGRPRSSGNGAAGRGGEWWIGVRSSCRAVADGRELGTRRMRSLEDAAGGSGRVKTFCKGVLGAGSGRDGDIRGPGRDGDGHGHHGEGGGDQGDDHDGDGEGHIGPDIGLAPFPPATPRVPAPSDGTPSPSPTHSAPATEASH
ncbi:hypothetical protein AB0N87_16950 [Streptomyces sp. NPDC093228]|uniref:hypothetical protein n=1 Tax=Streptomyces sp. NPDC093228 TaxID=3155070 RepID=UPI00343F3C3B